MYNLLNFVMIYNKERGQFSNIAVHVHANQVTCEWTLYLHWLLQTKGSQRNPLVNLLPSYRDQSYVAVFQLNRHSYGN